MFGFKKKQTEPAVEENKNVVLPSDTAYQTHWPWLRQFLSEQLPGAAAQPGSDSAQEILAAPEQGLQFWAEFYQEQSEILQLVLHCRQNDFTDELTEILVAAGRDKADQQRELAAQIQGLILGPLLNALRGNDGSQESLRLQGREHRFTVCESDVLGRGKAQTAIADGSLWQRFKSEIIPYLGCKKNYWLKLYQSSFGDELNCEVRLNDRLIPELSELLTQDAKKREMTDWDLKQTVMLLQDPETCIDYPFSAQEVRKYALQALQLFADEHDSDDVYQTLWAQSGDVSLACDLAHLLPEICCFKCVREADTPNKTFILRSAAWNDDLQLKESQFGCYDWFEQAINEYFSVFKPSRETLGRIIGYGATAKAMDAAMKNGSKTKNMRFSMLFWVPGEYILR